MIFAGRSVGRAHHSVLTKNGTDSGSQPADEEGTWPVLHTECAPACCADPAADDQADLRVKSRIVFRASWLDVGMRLACCLAQSSTAATCNRGAVYRMLCLAGQRDCRCRSSVFEGPRITVK